MLMKSIQSNCSLSARSLQPITLLSFHVLQLFSCSSGTFDYIINTLCLQAFFTMKIKDPTLHRRVCDKHTSFERNKNLVRKTKNI